MTFDVVITSYNRPEQVLVLAQQVLECTLTPNQLIIVDSSDMPHSEMARMSNVNYIRSSHKNQPYQRLLGVMTSNANIIIFLDDDLNIIRSDIFETLLKGFADPGIVGVSVGFDHQNPLEKELNAPLWNGQSKLSKMIWQLTGAPHVDPGNVSRLGLVGAKPASQGHIQTFNGANMAFRRAAAIKSIPTDLLALYERKLGKGEDKVISMLASQYGKLLYNPEIFLSHPPNDSSYFQNHRSFAAKVAYSRLYLSRIYARVFQKPMWKEYIAYYWFTLWRWGIAVFSWILSPSSGRKDKFLGIWDGLQLAIQLPQHSSRLTPDINWEADLQRDLTKAAHAANRV